VGANDDQKKIIMGKKRISFVGHFYAAIVMIQLKYTIGPKFKLCSHTINYFSNGTASFLNNQFVKGLCTGHCLELLLSIH